MITAISLDLWKTLVRGNPNFRVVRGELLAGLLGVSVEAVIAAVRQADEEADERSRNEGVQVGLTERLMRISELAGATGVDVGAIAEQVDAACAELVREALPPLTEAGLPETLRTLKASGYRLGILSNTGFLTGRVMREALTAHGVLGFFDAAIFSDEIGTAKPSAAAFAAVAGALGVAPNELLHVGDDPVSDIAGARAFGAHALRYAPAELESPDTLVSLASLPVRLAKDFAELPYSVAALAELSVREDGVLIDSAGVPLDGEQYGRFKYGDGTAGRGFGHQLAAAFLRAHPDLFAPEAPKDTRIVVATSPYKAIPKGATTIAKGFIESLNRRLVDLGKDPVSEMMILKTSVFAGDYGSFSAEERKAVTDRRSLFVPESFVEGKRLVLIDDVRITGTHEENLKRFFAGKGVEHAYFLYVAQVDPEDAAKNPKIEATLNHLWMDSPKKAAMLLASPEFALNARVTKYLLSLKDHDALEKILSEAPLRAFREAYVAVVNDGYAALPAYAENFARFEKVALARGVVADGDIVL